MLQPDRTVYVNGRFLTQTPTGMHRFAGELLTAWDALRAREARPCPVEVLTPAADCRKPAWKTLPIRAVPGARGHLWEQGGFLVNLLGSGPLLHPRQVVTLHDASAYDIPKLYTCRFRLLHRGLQEILSRKARRVLTVSEFSRRRLMDVLDLKALYENALAFVFPSRYEGFGIPPLEAMSLGCPVLSSQAGSLPEVLGDSAVFVDPDDIEAFGSALRRVIADEVLRQKLIAAGRRRAARFSWRAAAERLDNIVREIGSSCRLRSLEERPT